MNHPTWSGCWAVMISMVPLSFWRASAGIRFLLETGVSKYNSDTRTDIDRLYGPKSGKRVLVIGQVEDDASIQFGCLSSVTNNDLVRLAAKENPGAHIIYKPHPDILNRVRLAQSDPQDVQHLCQIITQPLSMSQAFETIDHVYTITSLAGFEALLRGLKVTTYGCPFYAGWGLTDDRQPNERHGRALTIEALFAGAYLCIRGISNRRAGRASRSRKRLMEYRGTSQRQGSQRWHGNRLARSGALGAPTAFLAGDI
ncbi:hypothetical protein LP421_16370 [Rhizobium sp. RCAM05350]|nr:hypothetical protein LP421_16370 [Rhizobium sp. RCAM05350]